MTDQTLRPCVLIPASNARAAIGPLVRRLRALALDVLVVDDGSTDGTAREAIDAGAVVISHLQRRGPGVALRSGLAYALERGYDPVVTMPADNAYDLDGLPRLLGELRHAPARAIGHQNGFRVMRRQAVLDAVRRRPGLLRLVADGARRLAALLGRRTR